MRALCHPAPEVVSGDSWHWNPSEPDRALWATWSPYQPLDSAAVITARAAADGGVHEWAREPQCTGTGDLQVLRSVMFAPLVRTVDSMLSLCVSRQQGRSPGTPVLASPHPTLQTAQMQTHFFQKSQGPEMDLAEDGVRESPAGPLGSARGHLRLFLPLTSAVQGFHIGLLWKAPSGKRQPIVPNFICLKARS